MHEYSDDAGHEAVTRLFELARSGETDNCEYSQLDSMIYGRLEQAYREDAPAAVPGALQVQTALA